ncbi:MAG: hypothetical protein WB644_13820 [Candidatus Cybelea sp.]
MVRNLNSFAATLLCDATVAMAVENRQEYYGKNQQLPLVNELIANV